MNHSRIHAIAAALLVGLVALPRSADAATVVINNLDGAGEGFNDPTVVSPVGGNSGVTLGAQRLIAFQYAADIWGSMLVSTETIVVDAQMDPLTCSASSATLGLAGPTTAHRDFPGAPVTSTWYGAALANKLSASDLAPGTADITATFNSAIGTTCTFPNVWYYGLDAGASSSQNDFVTVVLHEIGHGLGFLSFTDDSTGTKFFGFDDTYMLNLEDHDSGLLWPAMSDAQRMASATDTGDLHWVGATVVGASGILSGGRHSPSGHVEMYAPGTLQPGSSVSHFSTSLSPDEVMEPSYTVPLDDPSLARYLMTDIGWGSAGTPTTTSTTTSTSTTLVPVCAATPEAGCRLATVLKSNVKIKDDPDDTKDVFKWLWNKGAATTIADFDDPVNGSAEYRVCVYDGSGASQPIMLMGVLPGGTCGAVPCWKATSAGFSMKNGAGTPHGLTVVKFKAGTAGLAKVLSKGKGVNLPVPGLPLTLPVTVQLLVDDGVTTECWQTTYTAATLNDGVQFKAKGP